MPLSPPGPREFTTRRTITCEGYVRADGLMDIEGHLVDVRAYDMSNDWRGFLKAGDPAHDMWVRLTVDDDLSIINAESCTDGAPFVSCGEVKSHTQRLVGMKITAGFKKEMRARIGHTEGCTHIVTLVDTLVGVAVHTLAGKRRGGSSEEVLATFGARDPSRPALVDSCYSYAADGPVVERLYPMHFRPRP